MKISATGNNILNCLAEARRVGGLKLKESREQMRSGGDDGLWRVHLNGGHVVECTVKPGTRAKAEIVPA